jgi:hypothetical protein
MGRLEALLRRCQAGDEEALEELIRRWERRLFYYVRRLVAVKRAARCTNGSNRQHIT